MRIKKLEQILKGKPEPDVNFLRGGISDTFPLEVVVLWVVDTALAIKFAL